MKDVFRAAITGLALFAGAGAGLAAEPADFADWAGDWQSGEEQFITIAVGADALEIEGDATWGASDPERVELGAVNMGQFWARVPFDWIADGKLAFTVGPEDTTLRPDEAEDYDCVVELELRDDGLVAEDNMKCGGMNVTFSGEYERTE